VIDAGEPNPELHISATGSDHAGKNAVGPQVLPAANV
jgi:hypothetical protein